MSEIKFNPEQYINHPQILGVAMRKNRLLFMLLILLVPLFVSSGQVKFDPDAIGRVLLSSNDSVSVGTAFVAGESRSIYTCSHVAIADTMWFNCISSPNLVFRIVLKY